MKKVFFGAFCVAALLCVVTSVFAAEGSDGTTVTFSNVPQGTTIMVDGKAVPLVEGQSYPASAVVTLGSTGAITVNVAGNSTPATIMADAGASFTLSASSAVSGVIVTVGKDSSNVKVAIGKGPFKTITPGTEPRVVFKVGGFVGGPRNTGGGSDYFKGNAHRLTTVGSTYLVP